ncbi:Uncharacterized protein F44E2.2 [Camponotus floridanus]|uniref:Uncharacterized protein F44E2.2 n=1 Tax=Camponotus floridanus TaxID=104421 RepID=E2ANA4_CAMFO|nr:Uncharacterized protein F44E2.2 [Camponotus floridanus]
MQISTPEECARECKDGEQPKTCYYHFVLEYYTSNNRACDFCEQPLNNSGITSLCECVKGDGIEKTIFSINRMIPSPSIQVCKNDYIIIDVQNDAEGLEASIHWHGIFQNGYQYFDGVPFVTQCPILSSNTFRYQFRVKNSGTHFYHSHISVHMIDGQYGSLIVRDPPQLNPHYGSYDEDRLEHVIIISDWMHELSLERLPGRYRTNSGQTPDNFLINGRGNWTIEPSHSPWSSPIVVVKKKDGRQRFCIDFRRVNEVTHKDAYPLPQITATLDKLRGARYLSTLDLKDGYWQVPLTPGSRPVTAFTIPGKGLYQFTVMPFGLHSAPATFQRLLDSVLGPELEPHVFVYLDDIIIISRTFEKHLELLRETFRRLRDARLRLNPEKCRFCVDRLIYLGHVIDREGIRTDPEKIRAVAGWPEPQTVKQIRQFVGMASWYRRFAYDRYNFQN